MTNDDVRKILADKNITTDNVTQKQLQELHDILSRKLPESGCFRGGFEMNPMQLDENMKFMTCRADYFKEREAVSFNRDGFIGFAGWASSNNVKPILEGVVEWANAQ